MQYTISNYYQMVTFNFVSSTVPSTVQQFFNYLFLTIDILISQLFSKQCLISLKFHLIPIVGSIGIQYYTKINRLPTVD